MEQLSHEMQSQVPVFPQRLKRERRRRAWSQARLAEALETDTKTISRWERGVALPTPYLREKLCKLLDKTQEELGLFEESYTDTADTSPIVDPLLPVPGFFVGRFQELENLKQVFLFQPGVQVVISTLKGLPGVGKTTLAIHLVYESEVRAHFTDGILWAALGPAPAVHMHLNRWGRLLGFSQASIEKLNSADQWQEALRIALGNRRMLIVLDDVWKLEDAFTLQVGGVNCAYLLTTRFPDIALHFSSSQHFEIHEFDEQESMNLLSRLAPLVVAQETERVRNLAQAVGGLPLALTLMGNYLRKQAHSGQRRRIHTALERLSQMKERLSLSEVRSPLEEHPSLPHGMSLSVQSVIAVTDHQLNERVRSAFYALSLFPPKPQSFSEEAALVVADCTTEILDRLTDTGLLETQGSGRYQLHQTIAEYARLHLQERTAHQRLIAYTVDLLETHHNDYIFLEKENSLIQTALEIALQEAENREVLNSICAYVPFLLDRGLYDLARNYLEQAQTRAHLSSEKNVLCRILSLKGRLAYRQGEIAQAEHSFQEGLILARQLNNPSHRSDFLYWLGWFLWKQGRYQEADTSLREGLVLAQSHSLQEESLRAISQLGLVAEHQGKWQEALDLAEEGLALARRLGEREPIIASLCHLGIRSAQLDKDQEATGFFQEALTLARQIEHREWIMALLNNLGSLFLETEDYSQARAYLVEGLELARQMGHLEAIGHLLESLAEMANAQGEAIQAEAYLNDCSAVIFRVGNARLLCHYWYQRGLLALHQRHWNDAVVAFKQMQALTPEEDREMQALVLYGQAQLALTRGEKEKARNLGTVSRETVGRAGHRLSQKIQRWLDSLSD